SKLGCRPGMRKARQAAGHAPSGHTRAERRTVSGQMEAVARSPTHRAGLFRAAIQPRETIRVGARSKAPRKKLKTANRLIPGLIPSYAAASARSAKAGAEPPRPR